jgi:hypothetical protein
VGGGIHYGCQEPVIPALLSVAAIDDIDTKILDVDLEVVSDFLCQSSEEAILIKYVIRMLLYGHIHTYIDVVGFERSPTHAAARTPRAGVLIQQINQRLCKKGII